MKTLLPVILTAIIFFSCNQAKEPDEYFAQGTPESVGFESNILQPIRDTINSWVDKGEIMGAEVLVIKDGKRIMHFAEGWSDFEEKTPLQTNSIYNIRSQSKTYTGISIMQLVERGAVKLDDPVSRYLESFDNDRSADITIHQLLSHTAGLYGVYNDLPIYRYDYDSFEDLIDAIGENGPASEQGVMYYSDEGAYTAARVVSVASGLSPMEYSQKNILDPFQLQDTYLGYTPDVSWRDRMNSAYRYNGLICGFDKAWDKSQAQPNSIIAGVGSFRGTALDYARLLQILMDGGNYKGNALLSEESVDLMMQTHGEWDKGQYGYLLMTNRDPDTNKLLWFGHGGSDGTLALAFPEINTIVAYYTQSRYNAHRSDFLNTLRQVEYFKPYILETDYISAKDEKLKMIWSKRSRASLNPEFLGQYQNFTVESDNQTYKITIDSPVGIKTMTTYAYSENELFGYMDQCDKSMLGLRFMHSDTSVVCQLVNSQNTVRRTMVKNYVN